MPQLQPVPKIEKKRFNTKGMLSAIALFGAGVLCQQAILAPAMSTSVKTDDNWAAAPIIQIVQQPDPPQGKGLQPREQVILQPGTMVVGTYNILTIGAAPKGTPSWQSRADKVAKAVTSRNMDIVGFQESSKQQFGRLKQKMPSYQTFPMDWKDEDNSGSRAIFWNEDSYKKIDGGSFEISKLCQKSSMPWVKLQGKTGRLYVFNVHMSPNGPEKKPCTKNERKGGHGADNDNGPVARRNATKALLNAINANVNDKAPILIMGDFNSTSKKRSKDGGINASDLPYQILSRAKFVDSFDSTANRVGQEFSSSHGSTKKFSKGGDQIDHIFMRGPTPNIRVLRWQNVADKTTKGASDHTLVEAIIQVY